MYAPQPAPLGGNVEDLRAWAEEEFRKLADHFISGNTVLSHYMTNTTGTLSPSVKLVDGLLGFFGPDVHGPQA
ncbi:MAG: hypothetical protein RI936_1581, partial [Pseudomonadota bacterium]